MPGRPAAPGKNAAGAGGSTTTATTAVTASGSTQRLLRTSVAANTIPAADADESCITVRDGPSALPAANANANANTKLPPRGQKRKRPHTPSSSGDDETDVNGLAAWAAAQVGGTAPDYVGPLTDEQVREMKLRDNANLVPCVPCLNRYILYDPKNPDRSAAATNSRVRRCYQVRGESSRAKTKLGKSVKNITNSALGTSMRCSHCQASNKSCAKVHWCFHGKVQQLVDYIHTAKSVDPNELYQFALVVGKIMEAGKGLIGTDPVAKAAAKEFAREYIDTEHRRVATEIHQALIAVAKSVKLAARNSTLKDILAAQNKTNHCLADISESLATLVKQVAAVLSPKPTVVPALDAAATTPASVGAAAADVAVRGNDNTDVAILARVRARAAAENAEVVVDDDDVEEIEID